NIVVGIEIDLCRKGLPVPLDDRFRHETTTEKIQRKCSAAGAGVGWGERGQAGASRRLECVSVVIATRSPTDYGERECARCPKPLHENSLLCPRLRACSGNPPSLPAEVRCEKQRAR